MLLDWSAECSADDPALVVPWHSDSPAIRFVNLRDDPYGLDEIAEAEEHPALLHSLRALNASRSPLFTAKCDTWVAAPEEVQALQLNLMLVPEEAADGFCSYIDLLWRERGLFTSFHQQGHILHRLERRAAALDHPFALLEAVIRPALLDLTTPQEGFSVSLYTRAAGPTPELAYKHWAEALAAATALLRSKELVPQT